MAAQPAPAATPVLTEGRLTLADVTLHYIEAGSGEPVVLLHGFAETSREWKGVMARLAPHHRVVAPDLRGMGDSTRPLAGYDVASVAADVAALIQALGLERPRVVGHDLGGPVAYMLAAEPALGIRQLAFLEAPLYGVEVEGLAEVMKRLWHMSLFQVPDLPEFLIQGREETFLEYFMKMAAYNQGAITPELVAGYARAMRLPGALRASLAYYRSIPASAAQVTEVRRRGRLAMPVLALGGEASLGDLPLRFMREVADDVRGGMIPRCGHWVAEEQPDELAGRLTAFFAEA